MLDDWSDGRVDGIYERSCYLGAIDMLPEDVRAYTSAAADIARALQARGLERGPSGSAPESRELSLGGAEAAAAASNSRNVPAVIFVLTVVAASVLVAGSAGLIARRVRVRRRA